MSHNVPLPAGSEAPEFNLKDTPDQSLALLDFRGSPVVLIFYPADFGPSSSHQLAIFNEILPELQKYNAQVLGISVDSVWSHQAFIKDRNLHFPLLSDFRPKGEVAKAYNAYREEDGQAERALYVINAGGIVMWSYIAPVGVNPGADGVLQILESLGKPRKRVVSQPRP